MLLGDVCNIKYTNKYAFVSFKDNKNVLEIINQITLFDLKLDCKKIEQKILLKLKHVLNTNDIILISKIGTCKIFTKDNVQCILCREMKTAKKIMKILKNK